MGEEELPPEATPWYFHDSPANLDDWTAPLPTASTATVNTSKPGGGTKGDDDENGAQEVENATREVKETLEREIRTTVEAQSASDTSYKLYRPKFMSLTYMGSIAPETTWQAFSPTDNARLIDAGDNGEAVEVGCAGVYEVTAERTHLLPVYWAPLRHPSNVHRAQWFFSTTMTPLEPGLEAAIEEAFYQIRPWQAAYEDELQAALTVPEAADKLKVPVEYSDGAGNTVKATVVFPPCLAEGQEAPPDETERSSRAHSPAPSIDKTANKDEGSPARAARAGSPATPSKDSAASAGSPKQDKPDKPAPATADKPAKRARKPTAFVMGTSQLGIPLLSSLNSSSQMVSALLTNRPPPGTLVTVTRAFDWDAWKKLKSLPDRPTDRVGWRRPEVTELVLVLHGIGQKLTERMESFNFTYAINTFRIHVSTHTESEILQPVLDPERRAMVLPINWRRILDFERLRDVAASQESDDNSFSLKDITMPSIPHVRNLIADVMLDVPYYMSRHKKLLVSAAAREANRVYYTFCAHNPGFEERGRVHMIGHSLGSVLAVDLLSMQPSMRPDGRGRSRARRDREARTEGSGSPAATKPASKDDPPETKRQAQDVKRVEDETNEFRSATPDDDSLPDDTSGGLLDFDAHNLFLVGSPMAFFFLLENTHLYPRKLWDQDHPGEKPPYGCVAAANVYNVLHYSDPISYVLGPTADRFIASKTELATLPTEKAFVFQDPTAGSFIDSITSKLPFFSGRSSSQSPRSKNRSSSAANRERSPKPQPPSEPTTPDNKQREKVDGNIKTPVAKKVEASQSVELETRSFMEEARGEKIMRLLNDNGQLDWVIPLTGLVENQYLSMITAHSIYWDNRDFARLVAVECCRRPGHQNALPQYKAKRVLEEA